MSKGGGPRNAVEGFPQRVKDSTNPKMNYKHNPKLTGNARGLRKEMTKEENRLWYDFLKECPVRFLRQKVIDNYIVDFYCHKYSLVIELDGSQHYDEEGLKKDAIRTEKLEQRNLTVIRIPNDMINKKFKDVCYYLEEWMIAREEGRILEEED